MKLRRALLLSGVAALAYPGNLGCDFNEIDDPSFDLWCGDTLCAWQLEEGRISRAPTWHRGDSGVSFDATPTAISQYQPQGNLGCLRFDMVAKVEASAQATLELDFDDNGSVDVTHTIAETHWQNVEFLVRTPDRYDGIRYILRKQGGGRAVFGQLRVVSSSECSGPRPPASPQPAGSSCDAGTDCVSGLCEADWCVQPAGEPCSADGECASGQCCANICTAASGTACE